MFGLTDSPETRIERGMSFADYDRLIAINQTAIKWFDRDTPFCGAPEKFVAYFSHPELRPPATPALEYGSGYHHFILNPETFSRFYVIRTKEIEQALFDEAVLDKKCKAKGFSTKLKVYEGWAASQAEDGRKVLTQTSADRMSAMRDGLFRNTEIREHLELTESHTEVSALFGHELLTRFSPEKDAIPDATSRCFQLKCRWDVLQPGPDLLDLKSARGAHPDKFAKQAWALGYGLQAAVYLDGARANGIDKRRFGFIAQDTDWPFLACIHWLPEAWVKWGAIRYRKILLDIAESIRLNDWPGYKNGELFPPFYAINEIEMFTGERLEAAA